MKFLYISFMLFTYYCMIWGQDHLTFSTGPAHDINDNSTIITERTSEPDCPKNMLAYPEEEGAKDAWVCDCRSGLLYFLLNDSCYEPYRQGPCPPKHYIILPEGEMIARCVENPCLEDGVVPYNGTCYSLKIANGACTNGILGVNETTFQLECIGFAPQIIIAVRPRGTCPPGSRMSTKGACKKVRHFNQIFRAASG